MKERRGVKSEEENKTRDTAHKAVPRAHWTPASGARKEEAGVASPCTLAKGLPYVRSLGNEGTPRNCPHWEA